MALSPTDAARLAELQAAYDKLIAGTAVVRVSSGGRTVDYGPGDAVRLRGEIEGLAAAAAGGGRRRGALRFRVP